MTEANNVERFPRFMVHREWDIGEISRVGDLSISLVGSFSANGPDEYLVRIAPTHSDAAEQVFAYSLGTDWPSALIKARGYGSLLVSLAKHWGVVAEQEWPSSELSEDAIPRRPVE